VLYTHIYIYIYIYIYTYTHIHSYSLQWFTYTDLHIHFLALQSRRDASPHLIPLCGTTIPPTFLFPFIPVTFLYFVGSCFKELRTNELGKCRQINLPAEIGTNCNQREVYFVTTDSDRTDIRITANAIAT
jgi:hypothetical protein